MTLSLKDEFGVFVDDFNLRVGSYIIEPIKEHAELISELQSLINTDGFFYPPIVKSYKTKSTSNGLTDKEVPGSEKPLHLYPLPSSHVIYLGNNQPLSENFRYKDGALLIHLLGLFYGCRAQFLDWRFDTRLPMKQDGIAVFSRKELQQAMNIIFDTFSKWDNKAQIHYINILYLHARCISYQWDWEQFLMEYIVTDSLWRLFATLNSPLSDDVSHPKRIETMCKHFGLMPESDKIKSLIALRNDLFHEGFWDNKDTILNHGTLKDDSLHAVFNLQRLNQRLILTIGGFNSSFIKSDWTNIGRFSLFD